jgi:type II secretory pathway pseudopilin PulG
MKFFKSLKTTEGFTLVEMLLYMGLLSMLLLIFTNIFTAILDTQLSSTATGSVAQDGRFIYSRFIYDINQATAVTTPANLGDTTNILVLQNNGITYQYQLINGNLEIDDGTTSAQLNSFDTSVSNLQFKKIGNVGGRPTVQLDFTITTKINGHGTAESKNFQTTAGLR